MKSPFRPTLVKSRPVALPRLQDATPHDFTPTEVEGPNEGVNTEYGGAGTNVTVMAPFAHRLLEQMKLQTVNASGASAGAFIALADILEVDMDTKRDWIRRIPLEDLAFRARRPTDFVNGFRRAGFTKSARPLRTFVTEILDEVGAAQGRDVSTFGSEAFCGADGKHSRLQISLQLGTPYGLNVGAFSPDQRQAILERVTRDTGSHVARNLMRLRFPRIQQVILPDHAEALGFGPGDQLRLADVMPASMAFTPILEPIVMLDADSGGVDVYFDGGSGIDNMFHPDVRQRDFAFQKLPRLHGGLGGQVSELPPVAFVIGPRGSAGSIIYQGNPEIGLAPTLVFSLPPAFGILDFDKSTDEMMQAVDWGGHLADRVLEEDSHRRDEHSIGAYFRNYAELVERYQAAAAEPSPAAKKGWYDAIYSLGARNVAAAPVPGLAASRSFAHSSMYL